MCNYEKKGGERNRGRSIDGRRPEDSPGEAGRAACQDQAPSWPSQAAKVCSERREASEALKCEMEGGGQLKINCAGQAGQHQDREASFWGQAAPPHSSSPRAVGEGWERVLRVEGLPGPSHSQAPVGLGPEQLVHAQGPPLHPGCCGQVSPVWPWLVHQQDGSPLQMAFTLQRLQLEVIQVGTEAGRPWGQKLSCLGISGPCRHLFHLRCSTNTKPAVHTFI